MCICVYVYTRDEAWLRRCMQIVAERAMQARRYANRYTVATWPDRWSQVERAGSIGPWHVVRASAGPVEAPKSTEVDRLGFLETPKSIEVGRSGSVQAAKIGGACAQGAPRSVQWCAEVTKIGAELCREATNATVRTHRSFANHCWIDFSSKRVAFRRCRRACQPSEVPRLPAKSKVRHIALHVE